MAISTVRTPVTIFLLIAAALFGAGCKYQKPAEQRVAEFHRLYNNRQFPEIYNAADERLRASMTAEQFFSYVDGVRRHMGMATNSVVLRMGQHISRGSNSISTTLETSFERGVMTERFVFNAAGENLLLLEYAIEQPLPFP